MKWKRLTVKTVTSAEDLIIADLYEIGLEGAMIEDHVPLTALEKEQMFVDILPEGPEDDGIAYLSFFVEEAEEEDVKKTGASGFTGAGLSKTEDNSYTPVSNGQAVDIDALVEEVKEHLEDLRRFTDIGEGTVTVSETEDKDWMNNWKSFFHRFTVDDLMVCPSWESPEDHDGKVLYMDPGSAFGTGMHETTQLCIRQIKKYVAPGMRILDVGTGSGILGIVGLMYGAGHVTGTDLDANARLAVPQNLEMNHLNPDAFDLLIGNVITEKSVQDAVGYEAYEIVVANILAEVLCSLTQVITAQLKPGGYYITSGILTEKEELVTKAVLDAGMELVEVTRQGEWVSVTGRKKQ